METLWFMLKDKNSPHASQNQAPLNLIDIVKALLQLVRNRQMWIIGLIGCFITLIVGFIPPEHQITVITAQHFKIIFALGMLVMLLPLTLFFLHKKYFHNLIN